LGEQFAAVCLEEGQALLNRRIRGWRPTLEGRRRHAKRKDQVASRGGPALPFTRAHITPPACSIGPTAGVQAHYGAATFGASISNAAGNPAAQDRMAVQLR